MKDNLEEFKDKSTPAIERIVESGNTFVVVSPHRYATHKAEPHICARISALGGVFD